LAREDVRRQEQLTSLKREEDGKAGETEDGIGNKGGTGNRHQRRIEKPWNQLSIVQRSGKLYR